MQEIKQSLYEAELKIQLFLIKYFKICDYLKKVERS